MAYPDEPELSGRRMERHVESEHIGDGTGDELVTESVVDVTETFGGTAEHASRVDGALLSCGHVHRPGEYLARCDACSKKAKRTVYVCGECAFTCPVAGQSLCRRCGVPAPDGRYFSRKGLKVAKKQGWFDSAIPPMEPPPHTCRRGLLSWLLEWW
jgi:hypothetical protein